MIEEWLSQRTGGGGGKGEGREGRQRRGERRGTNHNNSAPPDRSCHTETSLEASSTNLWKNDRLQIQKNRIISHYHSNHHIAQVDTKNPSRYRIYPLSLPSPMPSAFIFFCCFLTGAELAKELLKVFFNWRFCFRTKLRTRCFVAMSNSLSGSGSGFVFGLGFG